MHPHVSPTQQPHNPPLPPHCTLLLPPALALTQVVRVHAALAGHKALHTAGALLAGACREEEMITKALAKPPCTLSMC